MLRFTKQDEYDDVLVAWRWRGDDFGQGNLGCFPLICLFATVSRNPASDIDRLRKYLNLEIP
jgi:hypothetical protein